MRFIFSGFWVFLGHLVLLGMVLNAFIITPLRLFIRSRNIKRHGWPPPHLNADGDFNKKDDNEEKIIKTTF
jgi:hypothetical protein